MVNAALYPSLKKSLLRLGGVYVVTNAMMLHPDAEAVQFRGLFALINFVIPGEFHTCTRAYTFQYLTLFNRNVTDFNATDGDKETTPIHSHVYQIARLTILAMKNFNTNKSILNRGCLVLRNLSLTPSHATILARTPGCLDMLLHSRQVCSRDALVQRSARTIMILIQRITEKELVHNGVASINASSTRISATGSSPTVERNVAGAPASPAKEESGKRTRNSCSY